MPEKFTKACPKCGTLIVYGCEKSLKLSFRKNCLCRKCAITKWSETRDLSVFKNESYRQKQRDLMKRVRNTDCYGERFKEKCRINKLNQIKKQGVSKTFNENACKFIDELNKKYGWNLQHAMNGGEFSVSGFSLDGYDKERKIVFEYDEPKHNKKCQIEKDKKRQKIIIEKLNPVAFFRFNEEFDTLIDVIKGDNLCQHR